MEISSIAAKAALFSTTFVLLATSLPASAAKYQQKSYPQIYGGLSAAALDLIADGNGLATSRFHPINLEANLGYKFNHYFAIEGKYGTGLDHDTNSGTASSLPVSIRMEQKNTWGAYLKGILPLGGIFVRGGGDNLTLYGLVGYGHGKTAYQIQPKVGTGTVHGHAYDGGLSYGGGLMIKMSRDWAIKAEYLHVYKQDEIPFDGSDVSQVSLGVNYFWSCR